MAKFKPGPMVAEARGTVGGTVFSRNRFGPYVRNFASPVQPRTPPQNDQRSAFTNVSRAWRDTLTAAERAAWEDYAQQTPLVDVFGDKQIITGLAMFSRFNSAWTRLVGDLLKPAPAVPGEAPMASFILAGTVAAGITITAFNPTLLAADRFVCLKCKAPVSQARNFYNGPFTLNSVFAGNSAPPITLVAPGTPQLGQRWHFQFRAFLAIGKVGPSSRYYVDILS